MIYLACIEYPLFQSCFGINAFVVLLNRMNIQFIFEANQVNIQTILTIPFRLIAQLLIMLFSIIWAYFYFHSQILPKVFNETLFTGSKVLYLIHNKGRKHKVPIKKMPRETKYALHRSDWKDFLIDSGYVNVDTFHFIREGENEFYVTAFHNDGTKCVDNYNLAEALYRQRRCLVTLEHIEESLISK